MMVVARHARASRRRGGFALPMALMALVILSAMVAGMVFVSTEELRAGRSDVATQRALAAAEWGIVSAGLQWDPSLTMSLPPGASTLIAGGPAPAGDAVSVWATRTGRRSVWLAATATSAADGERRPVRRTVAASMRLVGPTFPLLATLSARGRVTVSSGVVQGGDAAADTGWCDEIVTAQLAAIAVPDTTMVCGATCDGTVPAGVTGSPAVLAVPDLTLPGFGAESAGGAVWAVRRAAVVSPGGVVRPGPVGDAASCDRTDPGNWGDPDGLTACAAYYPIVHLTSSATLAPGSRGQGILVVDGSLTVAAGAHFAGIVIVSGAVVVTGLDAEVTGAVSAGGSGADGGAAVTDGGAVRGSECVVERASLAAARLRPTAERWWAELR